MKLKLLHAIVTTCAVAMIVATPSKAAPVRVIDGDTIEMDAITYRINGIDAPEQAQKCGAWRCGAAATDRMAELVAAGDVTCDSHGEDGYGRTIATCFADGRDLGAQLVGEGLAWAFIRYSDEYVAEEQEARAAARGVWGHPSQPPWEFRAARWSAAEEEAPGDCAIKGNISDGERIYHAPWSPWYGRTKINEAKGERWFCSEAEAVEAGWRAPRWK